MTYSYHQRATATALKTKLTSKTSTFKCFNWTKKKKKHLSGRFNFKNKLQNKLFLQNIYPLFKKNKQQASPRMKRVKNRHSKKSVIITKYGTSKQPLCVYFTIHVYKGYIEPKEAQNKYLQSYIHRICIFIQQLTLGVVWL